MRSARNWSGCGRADRIEAQARLRRQEEDGQAKAARDVEAARQVEQARQIREQLARRARRPRPPARRASQAREPAPAEHLLNMPESDTALPF